MSPFTTPTTSIDNWICLEQKVCAGQSGQRLDHYLGNCVMVNGASCSRAMFQQLIRDKHVLVQGKTRKNNYRLKENDCVEVFIPPADPIELIPEHVDFDVIFEDQDIIVVSKPPDLVVHPASGNMTGTLVHGLLYHCTDLAGINGALRPGIVHRLDKDTSGIMVVAKSDRALQSLVKQFKERKVKKVYRAIVEGVPYEQHGTISTLIGRHPVDRKKMAVVNRGGKEAITHWQCLETMGNFTMLEIRLETGRTHQIRVHLAHYGFPIVGDSVYGLRKKRSVYEEMGVHRQFLHACTLSFEHPVTQQLVEFEAPIPNDIMKFVDHLRS